MLRPSLLALAIALTAGSADAERQKFSDGSDHAGAKVFVDVEQFGEMGVLLSTFTECRKNHLGQTLGHSQLLVVYKTEGGAEMKTISGYCDVRGDIDGAVKKSDNGKRPNTFLIPDVNMADRGKTWQIKVVVKAEVKDSGQLLVEQTKKKLEQAVNDALKTVRDNPLAAIAATGVL